MSSICTIEICLMKIEEMVDVFLNSANFAKHTFSTLAPPSGYALNLKALIKVSKVSWTSQLSYEILRSSLERKFDKTNFISPKSTPPKSLHLLGLRKYSMALCSLYSLKWGLCSSKEIMFALFIIRKYIISMVIKKMLIIVLKANREQFLQARASMLDYWYIP